MLAHIHVYLRSSYGEIDVLKYHQLYYLALERRQFDIAIQSNMRLSGIVNCAGFKGSCYLLRAVIPPR